MTPPLRRRVEAAEAGVRADVAIAKWLGEPRARTQARLAAGEITVDARVPAKSHRLAEGELVEVIAPPRPPPVPAPPPVPVRYEDAHLAVVAKPAGLVVHPGAGTGPGPTLVDALAAAGMALARGGDPARPGVVHRLDRGTSGLLIVAKSEEARIALVAALADRAVQRRYWALLEGHPEPRHATIEAPLARDPRHRTRFRVDPAGRPAVTHLDVVETLPAVSVARLRLETGRTHQIRVHCAAIGHPVAGDLTYRASPATAAALGLERPALHAAGLRLQHPISGDVLDLEEPLPDDLVAALAHARGDEFGPVAPSA